MALYGGSAERVPARRSPESADGVQISRHGGAKNSLECRGVDRDRVAPGRWITGGLLADDLDVAQVDPDVGERVRDPGSAAQLQHPCQQSIEAVGRYIKQACDDLALA